MLAALNLLKPTDQDLVPGFKNIVIRQGYMGGKPALLGKRISVAQILEGLSEGASHQDLIEAYDLTEIQINEVLGFAAAVVQGTAKCG
jgi:uncharacterized protein (DUF433 family)